MENLSDLVAWPTVGP